MKKLISLAIAAASVTLSVSAQAQFAKPEDAIKYRQSSLFVMAQNFGRLNAMAQGRMPFDAKAAGEAAATVEFMSKLPWAAFGDGTDKGANPTRAKAEIWSEKAKFMDLAEKLQVETAKLNAAAKTGSLDNIKATLGGVGAACKACHDSYQAKL